MIQLLLRTALATRRRGALLPLYRVGYWTHNRNWWLNTRAMADDYAFLAAGSARVPGLAQRFEGRTGYLAAQRQLLDAVDVKRVRVDDVLPLGRDRVVVLSRFEIGAGSNTIDQHCLELHEFRRGALVRQTYWFDRDEGRRELGL